MDTLDNAVEIVSDILDRNGQADRTLVVLTIDHGGVATSEGWPTAKPVTNGNPPQTGQFDNAPTRIKARTAGRSRRLTVSS